MKPNTVTKDEKHFFHSLVEQAEKNGHTLPLNQPKYTTLSYGEWPQHKGGRSITCASCRRSIIVQKVNVTTQHPLGLASLGSIDTVKCVSPS